MPVSAYFILMNIRPILLAFLLSGTLAGIAQIPNTISPADKIYGLSRFWQEVNYNFVYLDKIGRPAWDSAYISMIPQVAASANDYDYYRLLQRFCALLKDGHTQVFGPPALGRLIMQNMYGDTLMSLTCVEGMPVVERTLKKNMGAIPIGSAIIAVNGIPVEQYLRDSVEPYISSSTDYVRRDIAAHYLIAGMAGTTYHLRLKKPDGSIGEITLTHNRTHAEASDFFPPVPPSPPLFDLRWYKNDIAYIGLNSFGDPKIDTLFIQSLPELYKAQALIIDLRNNGGGSTGIGTTILEYLTKDTVLYHASTRIRLNQAYRRAVGAYVEAKDTVGDPLRRQEWLLSRDSAILTDPDDNIDPVRLDAKRLVVPTVILVSHNTASAAEDFLLSASNQRHMIRIGQYSYGSTGQPEKFDMPGGGSARICVKKDTYPDGTEFVGKGIAPDIRVEMTIKDFIDKKDPALDRSIVYLTQKLTKKAHPAAAR